MLSLTSSGLWVMLFNILAIPLTILCWVGIFWAFGKRRKGARRNDA